MQIAFYRPHRLIRDIPGRVVCWWTNSEFSHCELVIDGICHSSSIRDGGVRAKRINLAGRPHWQVLPLPGADAGRALAFFQRTKGEPYGWLDLVLHQVFRSPAGDQRGWFCSEWVAEALGMVAPRSFSPGDLYRRFSA